MKKYKLKSYCKINLTLRVLRKLKNGYHQIESLITFNNLYDEISIKKIKSLRDNISFTGQFKNGINKNSNTVTKLLSVLRSEKILNKNYYKINVKKNIPHGSGLGGGSSNAATLMNFFNSQMNLNIKKKKMHEISGKVGFDTAILLSRKNTFLSSKNKKIIRLNKKFKLNILIIYPNLICSTKKIYLKNRKFSGSKNLPKLINTNKNNLMKILKKENNDLEQAVTKIYPKVKKIINFIKLQKGCYFSRITGSGSAIIGIFSDIKSAIYVKKLIRTKFPKYWSNVSKTI